MSAKSHCGKIMLKWTNKPKLFAR